MRFTIVTAFPEFFDDFLSASIIGRAVKNGLLDVKIVDLRSFGRGGYRQIDDYAFGAGGMVLMAQPLSEALESLGDSEEAKKRFVVYPTPQGVLLTQEIVETLALQEHVVIVCGHYEGLDERFVEREVDLEVTIGDCVLTGGEIPAMAIIDAVARLIPGVVGRSEAVEEDSFYRGMLDHPHYTRPATWEGHNVPEALLSGNAADIDEWRRKQAVARTLTRRPDLLTRSSLLGYIRGGFYFAVELLTDAFDAGRLEELAELCESYGADRLFLIVRDPEERDVLRQMLRVADFPTRGRLRLMPSPGRVIDNITDKEGAPLVVGVFDEPRSGSRHWLEVKRLILEKGGAVLFSLSPGDEAFGGSCDVSMSPLQKRVLPLSGKTAVILDRFLGSR